MIGAVRLLRTQIAPGPVSACEVTASQRRVTRAKMGVDQKVKMPVQYTDVEARPACGL